ncbi:MAG: hypothetical protein KA362_12710 [Chloroflexi bacterium]|nr:hypothetical protein [Chloroflexota bacterium]MBK7178133.1 hypothetical protein [Chloroflexota bacterium]MBK7919735.1 hypothetical protein [Chloroflexota bacterium]MBK8931808.1 hypothetical protein [Chloroflexota bacterium]MBP6804964.1 hypothetical protein [Chloroflexota bacterium]
MPFLVCFIVLLLWGLWVGLVQLAPAVRVSIPLVDSPRPLFLSLAGLVVDTAVPHHAFPLSCCLLN